MKKRFEYIRSQKVITELVMLAVTVFLLIASASTLFFSIILPDTLLPTIIGVVSLVAIALYLLPRIKSDSENKTLEVNTDNGTVIISGKPVKDTDEINILKFNTEDDKRFVVKFTNGEMIDSREYKDSERLLTLIPRVFPNADIKIHHSKSVSKSFIILGLLFAVIMFILGSVL